MGDEGEGLRMRRREIGDKKKENGKSRKGG